MTLVRWPNSMNSPHGAQAISAAPSRPGLTGAGGEGQSLRAIADILHVSVTSTVTPTLVEAGLMQRYAHQGRSGRPRAAVALFGRAGGDRPAG